MGQLLYFLFFGIGGILLLVAGGMLIYVALLRSKLIKRPRPPCDPLMPCCSSVKPDQPLPPIEVEEYDLLESFIRKLKRRFGHYRSPRTGRTFAAAFTEELHMGQLRTAVTKLANDAATTQAALMTATTQVATLTAANADLTTQLAAAQQPQPVTTPKGRTLDADDLVAADETIDAAGV